MAETLLLTTWNPLDYFSPEELARLDERFDYALRDATRLVFWTGLSFELAQRWAEQHGLQTLTIAMGPLFSDRDVGGARYGKSTKAWSKYMKGASGRFAEYACRGGRRAIVLTKPPPNTYSVREWSNYQHLEEPILNGAFGGSGVVQIDYVHPTIKGATTFQYQVWPLDRSSEWYAFFRTGLPQGGTTRDVNDKSAKGGVTVGTGILRESVAQNKDDIPALAHEEQTKAREREAGRKKTELDRQQAREKKEANRKRAEEARAKKEARRRKAELDRQKALKKREESGIEAAESLGKERSEPEAGPIGAREGSFNVKSTPPNIYELGLTNYFAAFQLVKFFSCRSRHEGK